jgi:hypothetical protein
MGHTQAPDRLLVSLEYVGQATIIRAEETFGGQGACFIAS